jgi:hypothetical protein
MQADQGLFDSLHHCAAVVGLNTSAMIEAAIVGRPVFSILAEEFAGTQEGTIHFHHLLPENGGCVRIASSLDEHVEQLTGRLRDPEASRAETERFVAHFIRPHGLGRPATPLFADAVERLAAAPAPAAETQPRWSVPVRAVLLLASLPELVVPWFQGAEEVTRVRKRTSRLTRRGRRAVARTMESAGRRLRTEKKAWSKRWQRAIRELGL